MWETTLIFGLCFGRAGVEVGRLVRFESEVEVMYRHASNRRGWRLEAVGMVIGLWSEVGVLIGHG